nr:HAD-IB family phosphatase [Streptomyces sp. SID5468]
MDGTLLYGSSANVELARQLDLVADFEALDADFSGGLIDTVEYARQAYRMWRDLTANQVEMAFDAAPWLTGIREVWADIRARGEYCAVISLSPDFFVSRLMGWGAHAAFGGRFPELPFRGKPLDPAGLLDPAAKVRIADELCERYGLTRDDCVAYGDSSSDTALFKAVPVSVAVNGDRHVEALASFRYAGRDLRGAYELALD